MAYITTASGGRFHFDHRMSPDDVRFSDVAIALSNICRWTGQIEEFYSVAEHSWHCSYIVPPEHALCALLHDATEPYTNDLARPLKRTLPDYMAAEDRVWREAVAPAFGLPEVLPQCVKDADTAMLKCEVYQLYPHHVGDDLAIPGPQAARILRLWSPKQARHFFTKRYLELTRPK